MNADYVIFSNQNYRKPVLKKPYVGYDDSVQVGLCFTFLLDDFLCHLDYRPTISGEYPLLNFIESLDDILFELAERNDIERYGIALSDCDDDDNPEYELFGTCLAKNEDSLQPTYSVTNITVEAEELINGFIGCEIYQYDLLDNDKVD